MVFKKNNPGCGVGGACGCFASCWDCDPLESISVEAIGVPTEPTGGTIGIIDVVPSSNDCCGLLDGTYAIGLACEEVIQIPQVASVEIGPNNLVASSCPALPGAPAITCEFDFDNALVTESIERNYIAVCAFEKSCLTGGPGAGATNEKRNLLTLSRASLRVEYGKTGSTYWVDVEIGKAYQWLEHRYAGIGPTCSYFDRGEVSVSDHYRGEWDSCGEIDGSSLTHIERIKQFVGIESASWEDYNTLTLISDEDFVYWGMHNYDSGIPRAYEFRFCPPEEVTVNMP